MADKSVRDELAELTEAVRELRDREVADELRSLRAEVEKLRAERAGHTCHGCHHSYCNWGHCGCWITHYAYTNYAAGGAAPMTYTVTNGGTNVSVAPWVTTNAAAGAVTTYSITN